MENQLDNYKLKYLCCQITSDHIDRCRSLKYNEGYFSLALEIVVQHSAVLFDSECDQKSSMRSIKLRNDGNKSFMGGQYDKAVKEYTESIVYAADSSEELALAYANRSAALLELEKYTDCIDDIERALNQNYPDRLKTKLHKRKGVCLSALGCPGADSSFQEALVWLDKTTLSKDKMNESEIELRTLISAPPPTAKPAFHVKQYPLPKILTPNADVPCASDAVTVKYSPKFGRHLVATRKIKPGEVLILEKPYCSKLISENIYTHCSYCLQLSSAMIPCERCVDVAYCSKDCKDKAYDAYHEVECGVVGLLRCFSLNDWFWISTRMAITGTQKGTKLDALKQELKKLDKNQTDPCTRGFSDDGKFHCDQYRSIYGLDNNADNCPTEQLFSESLRVALIVCILVRESELFGKKLSLDTLTANPDVIFFGELILKHFHVCFINLFNLGLCQGQSLEEACGLMPFTSLLNHSCDPNTLRQRYTDFTAIFAAHPIEPGEQIFGNYGPHFTKMAKSERHQVLNGWGFSCDCIACTKDWPVLCNMTSYKQQPLAKTNKSKLAKILQKLGIISKCLIRKNNTDIMTNMLNELLKTIEALFKLAQKPCKELYMVVCVVQHFYLWANALLNYEPGSPGCDKIPGPALFYTNLDELLSQI